MAVGLPGATFSLRIVSNHRIRKVDTNGIISTVAGTGYGGAAPATAARRPMRLWISPMTWRSIARATCTIAMATSTGFSRWGRTKSSASWPATPNLGYAGDGVLATNTSFTVRGRHRAGRAGQLGNCGLLGQSHPDGGYQRHHHDGGGSRSQPALHRRIRGRLRRRRRPGG